MWCRGIHLSQKIPLISGHENPKRPNLSFLGFPAAERGDAAEEKGSGETSHCGCIKRRPKKL